jgi:N-acetylneuraminic acid mutarotase
MIVWGGHGQAGAFTDGGMYDPVTDTWVPIAATGAPSPRQGETALWTGSRMIVWGGITDEQNQYDGLSTGALYDPAADTWTPISTAGVPAPRGYHAAIWTGSRMIVYGGKGGADFMHRGDGAAYDPATDTWSPLPGEGSPGVLFSRGAVWIGSAMLVLGTDYAGTRAASYDPAANAWSPLGTCDAPEDAGFDTTVWTGTAALIWPAGGAGAIFTP